MTVSYEKLIIWQKADILVKEIYTLTSKFPRQEIYGLTSQIRRAALSVVLNIIEGYARNNKEEFEKVECLRNECGKVLWKFIQSQTTGILAH